MKKIQIVAANFNFLPDKLDFYCGNYSSEETNYSRAKTIRGNTICFFKAWNFYPFGPKNTPVY